uniref:Uncharacterized protein n=1 Tax=Cucumis melo TaxID=3656 RepID=A0A9I9EMF1_CUCME
MGVSHGESLSFRGTESFEEGIRSNHRRISLLDKSSLTIIAVSRSCFYNNSTCSLSNEESRLNQMHNDDAAVLKLQPQWSQLSNFFELHCEALWSLINQQFHPNSEHCAADDENALKEFVPSSSSSCHERKQALGLLDILQEVARWKSLYCDMCGKVKNSYNFSQDPNFIDVFGFGILVLELLTGQKALDVDNGQIRKGMILEWFLKKYEKNRSDMACLVVLKMNSCPRQLDYVECGYYVQNYIHEIVHNSSTSITSLFNTKSAYRQEEIDEIRTKWAAFV